MIAEWRAIVGPGKVITADYWRLARGTLVLVVVVSLLSAVLAVVAPFIFSRLIDRLSADTGHIQALTIFAIYAVILGISSILGDTASYFALMASRSLDYVVATRFFDRVLKKTVVFFTRHNPTEIHNALAIGQEGLNELFQLAMVTFLPGVMQIVLSLLLLGTILNLGIVAVVMVYGAIYVVLTHYANVRTRRYIDGAVDASQTMPSSLAMPSTLWKPCASSAAAAG